MFMKHYAPPHRCEPSIEVFMKMGVQCRDLGVDFLGCVRVDVNVNEGLKLL